MEKLLEALESKNGQRAVKRGCRDRIIAAAYFHAIFYVLSGLDQINKEYYTALFLVEKSIRNPPVCGRSFLLIQFKIFNFMRFLLRINVFRPGHFGSSHEACLCYGPLL